MYFPSSATDLLKPPSEDQFLNVVGVVKPVRLRALAEGGNSGLFGAYYFPIAQSVDRGVSIVIRTTQDPESLTSAMRAAMVRAAAVSTAPVRVAPLSTLVPPGAGTPRFSACPPSILTASCTACGSPAES